MSLLSVEEKAYQSIIEMIIMHQYPPGANVAESQIADLLKISRTPVRSALKRLVADGLLESTMNKGCSVPSLSRRDLDQLFEFRFAVEPACVRDAAKKCTYGFKTKMDALIEEERATISNNPGVLHIVNEKIHNLIVEITGNPYYVRPVKQVNWRTQLYLFFFDDFYSDRVERLKLREKGEYRSPLQHIRLFESILRNDVESADAVIHEHISSTYKFLTKRNW